MDRERKLIDLAKTEEHVAQGDRHITRQRDLIEQLEREGHDATDARSLLRQFEDLQALHIDHRNRLRAEIDSDSA